MEEQIFKNHYEYAEVVPIDNLKKDAGQNEQVSADYQGRVLYELLQNAFDKAQKNILVQIKDNSLIVANDGKQFTYNASHDYVKGETESDNFIRYDFQSICSSSNSNKNTNESIGNKGVGFKSVFAIANYANIYTKGIVYKNNQEIERTPISFRLYGKFQDADNIPSEFEAVIQERIKSKIEAIQREKNFIHRGLPGYYYPLHITDEPKSIKDLFDKGFVTIIELPFFEKETVDKLFEEIKKIHFNFIKLKYANDFQIEFDKDGEIFTKNIHIDESFFFTTKIVNEQVKKLANDADINIKEPQIAIFFKDSEVGKFYNYLPTEKDSPFKHVDFHADFHAKVDRKNIDFNESTPIGKYNKALLNACVELYFVVLNSYLEESCRVELQLEYIDYRTDNHLTQFNWKYFAFSDEKKIVISAITSILKMHSENYETASLLCSNIAKQYFDATDESTGEEERLFFDITLAFIAMFVDDYYRKDGYRPSQKFKTLLGDKLKRRNAKVVPHVILNEAAEIFYKEKIDTSIDLPDGITITDFEILDSYFQSCLGISKFTEFDSIIKYFKQCRFDGTHLDQRISESQQIAFLSSLVTLIANKYVTLSTHRFTKAYNRNLRENNSQSNQANFNSSTLFLKTGNGRYKPAQLCRKRELDLSFIRSFVGEENELSVLLFLGVSFDDNYIFADRRLYDNLKDGLDFIPSISRKELNEDIDEEVIRNLCIIGTKNQRVISPAIINRYESYKFLEKLVNPVIKEELKNLLANRYDEFPTVYKQILKDHISKNLNYHKEVVRLYQSIFRNFANSNDFLVIQNGQLHWTDKIDFLTLNTKDDYDLCKVLNGKKILCFYGGFKLVPEQLKETCWNSIKGEIIHTNGILQSELKTTLQIKMIYLLICISNTDENISSVNYLDAKTDLSILNNRFTALKIYGVDTLSQEVSYGEFNILTNPMYAFNKDDSGNLYINNKATNKHKAEAIASFLFENTSITELIELILFYKDIELIKEESAEEDIARISQRWLPDYEDKYQSFQNDIRSNFPELPRDDEKWYIYNESHKSKFLIQLVNTGRLHELQNSISDCKKNYEDYFDNFHEEIDNAAIIRMAAEFLCFLEGKENVELDLINRIHKLSKELGSEEDLSSIRKYLSESYTDFAEQKIALHKLTEKEMKIEFQNRIDKIYNSLPTVLNKDISKDILHGGFSVAVSLTKKTKVINFHNANFTFNQQQEFEATGASGEIEVLYLLLEEFLRLDIFNQRKAIDEICDLLYKECKLELEEQKHNIYEVMNDVDLLKKALIPLFYITMHNKYLSVDLIGYINGKATLFEVKTTKFNNNKFYLSIAEVQVARKYKDQYVIVRVSDNKINFIGNPFFEFDDKITKIKYDGFIIQPRTFEFIFTN